MLFLQSACGLTVDYYGSWIDHSCVSFKDSCTPGQSCILTNHKRVSHCSQWKWCISLCFFEHRHFWRVLLSCSKPKTCMASCQSAFRARTLSSVLYVSRFYVDPCYLDRYTLNKDKFLDFSNWTLESIPLKFCLEEKGPSSGCSCSVFDRLAFKHLSLHIRLTTKTKKYAALNFLSFSVKNLFRCNR